MNLEPKIYKKRPHRKVKSGCTTCKRRKIKCDEQHPRCQNCVRYSAECVYPTEARDAGSSLSPTPPRLRTPAPDSPRDDLTVAESSASSQNHTDSLCMDDLSLMHQWTVSTCYSFGDEFSGEVEPWRFEIPILARRYPFLMRGLLAVSAIHLARTFPTPELKAKYIGTAAYHQDIALPECRRAFLNVTEDNISAILAFSATATVLAFAAPQQPGTLFTNGPPEWFSLRMGPNDIPSHWHSWIDSSILSRHMHRRRLLPIDPMGSPDDRYLEGLQSLCNLSQEEQGTTGDYEMALHLLRQAFAHTHNPESQLGPKSGALFWIECVPKGYIELLALQKPRALILLAHCCVLFKRAEHFWYFEGLAEYTLSEIRPLLSTDLLPWIEWPLQVCSILQHTEN